MRKVNLLDCTFRDGGYYNNWSFEKKLIKDYLKLISKTNIEFVEIGFFTIKKNNNLGLTANINKKFFRNFKIPKKIKIGIMINVSELLSFQNFEDLKERLDEIDYKNINFIRLACHLNEYKKIIKFLKYFKKKNLNVFLNIMQASEIKNEDLNYISKSIQKYIDILYFADSFGSLNENDVYKLSNKIEKKFYIPYGIHAHDNLGKALKNSLTSIRFGASWVDGTILGMGRGPGNTKTEELIDEVAKINRDVKEKSKLLNLIIQFKKLKKRYNWGLNRYYNYSGIKKIHPTYVQMLMADKRVNSYDIMNILKNISKNKSKKFDPNELYSAAVFYSKRNIKPNEINYDYIKKFSDFIIINSQLKKTKFNKKIEKLLKNKNVLKIMINETKNKRLETLCDMNSTCHPLRLMAMKKTYDKSYKKILLPLSNIRFNKDLKINRDKIIDYPILLKKKIVIDKLSVTLPEPLSLIYTICFLISLSITNIKLLGFEGYKKTDPFQDKTQDFLSNIIKNNKYLKLISLNKTKFKFS